VPPIATIPKQQPFFGARTCIWRLIRLGLVLGLAAPASAAEITLEERLGLLKASYPEVIAGIDGNRLVLKNGKSYVIEDGRAKTHQEKLKNADIEDMLSQVYPLGDCFKGPVGRNFDPGRIRNLDLMREIFGRSKEAVIENLAVIDWFGRSLRFTKVAGAAAALARVRDELAALAPDLRKYFDRPAGTFHWRAVAGTKRLSQHDFASAIDINTKYAAYWLWSGAGPGAVAHVSNRIPMKIVEVFERHGFIWGGKWYHYDTMHFSYRPEMIAIARLAQRRGCAR
jgi:hypothetical protein